MVIKNLEKSGCMLKALEYSDAMKVGYGYKRRPKSFTAFGVNEDKVWIDTSEDRVDLDAMMGLDGAPPGINPGETLVLLQHSDLGEHWMQRERVLRWMAEHGIYVQVRDQDPVLYDTPEKLRSFKDQNGGSRTQADPGRPRKFKWTPEKARAFAEVWYGPGSVRTVERKFKEITEQEYDDSAANACQYLFGPRRGTKKDRYLRLIGEAGG